MKAACSCSTATQCSRWSTTVTSRWPRGEAAAAEVAGRSFILVDWYLRLACGQSEAIVNETCSWLVFDAQGSLALHVAHATDGVAAPTEAQWAQVRSLAFGDASVPPER